MEHIVSITSGTYDLEGDQVHIEISAGIATESVEKCDIAGMHMNADLALYEAKSEEGRQWALFVSAMDTKYRGRQKLKADLRQAIANGEIKVVYQPIVSAQSLRVVAMKRSHVGIMQNLARSLLLSLFLLLKKLELFRR